MSYYSISRTLLIALVAFAITPSFVSAADGETPKERVGRLIEQLGDTSFAGRERAQAELARLGVTAFDQLFTALRHDDLEVARRAQYLIRSVEIEWMLPEFSDEVNSYLNRYETLSVEDRRSRIGEISRVDSLDALSALCRIARYDVSDQLSKEAALAAAIQFQDAGEEKSSAIAEVISQRIDGSPRIGAEWLTIFRLSLNDPAKAIEQWDAEVTQEIELFVTRPDSTDKRIVLDLVRWEVDQLREQGKDAHALEVMGKVVEISTQFKEAQLIDLTTWLLDRKGPSVVEQLAQFHAQRAGTENAQDELVNGVFGDSPALLYLLAEAKLVQDKVEDAQKHADVALAMSPGSIDSHEQMATMLTYRGAFRWSRAELEFILSKLSIEQDLAMQIISAYAEMEHDLGNHAKAAEVCWPWVQRIEEKFGPHNFPDDLRGEFIRKKMARAYYFRATAKNQSNDLDGAKADLEKSLEYYPDEADSLILAYRLSDDPKWQAKARSSIDNALKFLKKQSETFEKQYKFIKRNGRGNEFAGEEGREMRRVWNQYAWLVSNTYGDVDHAIRCSELSLELEPDQGAYLDTLAHCYAAKKEYGKALEIQKQAVRQLLHSGQIRDKYEFFARKCRENDIEYEPMELPDSPDSHFPDSTSTE